MKRNVCVGSVLINVTMQPASLSQEGFCCTKIYQKVLYIVKLNIYLDWFSLYHLSSFKWEDAVEVNKVNKNILKEWPSI